MNVANKADEIADVRIKQAETRRRICLRCRRIGKVTDGLQTDHRGDIVAAFFASAGINLASDLRWRTAAPRQEPLRPRSRYHSPQANQTPSHSARRLR